MFTDMVGSTAAAQADESEALRLRDEQAGIVRPLFAAHQGREIKSMGDGFLAEFDSALRAVQCAIDIQQHLHERNAQPGVRPILLRIGVHLGDVEQRESDIFGDAVNIASRVEPLAAPGGICISGQVFDQIRNKIPNRLEKLAPTALKHVVLPIDIYRVSVPWEAPEVPSGGVSRSRLAVLPLANISPDPKDEYFADGLTEELISALSKIRSLRVIARTSVGQYKSTSKTVAQIGTELGVTSVLEGSVRKAGNRLRITLQLIDVNTQDHMWADSYDRNLDDVFAVQTEVAERTAGALRLELLGPEREEIRKEPTSDLGAYELYLQGVHAARGAHEGMLESISYFEEAIRKDPRFPDPYAALANVLIGLAGDALAADEAFPRARDLITRALELSPDSSDAHTARGNLALQRDNDWAVAEAEFQRAISLNPSNAAAHFWHGELLKTIGRYGDAVKEFRTTVELDPLFGVRHFALWMSLCLAGDFDSAVALAKRWQGQTPERPVMHLALGLIYAQAGRKADALREADLAEGPLGRWAQWTRAVLWAHGGRPDEARRILKEMEETSRTAYVSPEWLAEGYAALGDREKAIELLERDTGYGARSLWINYQDIAFDSIRGDPRFRSMLSKAHLPTEVRWARASEGVPPENRKAAPGSD